MKTITPENETAAMSILCALEHENALLSESSVSMERPLEQMFNDFLVFISKTDFE